MVKGSGVFAYKMWIFATYEYVTVCVVIVCCTCAHLQSLWLCMVTSTLHKSYTAKEIAGNITQAVS
jgi:hypothetical protein